MIRFSAAFVLLTGPFLILPLPIRAADMSVPELRLALARDVMHVSNGTFMVDTAARHTMHDLADEYREYRSGGSAEKVKLFENALAKEEPTAASAIMTTIINALGTGLSEHELRALSEFCKSSTYKDLISSLPLPLVSIGILNLPHLSNDVPAHSGEPSKRDIQRLYARFVPADRLDKVKAFLSSDVGRKASIVLSTIENDMYFDEKAHQPGFVVRDCEDAKKRALEALRKRGALL